ncbi:MAG: hypothetical protein IM557_03285 [Chitinophagaceae bacterium]|nr:hypothetical protein [Chitinophagaceae bacterium]
MEYVTRIAPSPTGMLHFGTARTAYFCWLAAKATGGQFILRLDDTDTERNKPETIQPIYDGLKWLGLDWDRFERQSQRTSIYKAEAERLLEHGFAFRADNGAIILNWQDFMPRSWRDEVADRIPITDTNIEQINGRTVLLRGGDKLGEPTYQFASVIDDYLMSVNFIIRGTDHITNTAKQLAIWSAIQKCDDRDQLHGAPPPKFAHVGLIFKDKKKMSKRDGAASLLDYRDRGYSPDALLNFMLRLGWGPREDNKENSIIGKDKAIRMFLTEGSMRNTNANFDQAKLDWFQKVYSRKAA